MISLQSHVFLLMTSLWLCEGRLFGGVGCAGGRSEGDKWFDGCQWCVCQSGRPVCSPRDCSKYVAQVAPCDNLYSRWYDGCYHCSCGISGIECKADWTCVLHMSSEISREALSRMKCPHPIDYRCICGVDGVPSCSAEVIDRSTYQSTLIFLNLTNPNTFDKLSQLTHREQRARKIERNRLKRRARLNDLREQSHSLDALNSRRRNTEFSETERNFDTRRLQKRRTRIHKHGRNRFNRTVSIPAPSSLLIATDNRCRFGARWYGGSLRCYCDVSGAITCGDPSFVASRIDGFRVESKLCEIGHVWEEVNTCRSCDCPVSGMVICQRSTLCPFPYLIQTKASLSTGEFRGGPEVTWNRERTDVAFDVDDDGPIYKPDGSGSHGKMAENEVISVYENGKDSGEEEILVEFDPNSKQSVVIETDDDPVVIETDDDDFELDLDDNTIDRSRKRDDRYTTVVTIRECKPGSRWRDGCLRCQCTNKGKKVCDDQKCPKFDNTVSQPSGVVKDVGRPERPMQRPPPMVGLVRYSPIESPSWELNQACGKFSLGQRFWKQCNLCVCTRKGPRCTAKNCG